MKLFQWYQAKNRRLTESFVMFVNDKNLSQTGFGVEYYKSSDKWLYAGLGSFNLSGEAWDEVDVYNIEDFPYDYFQYIIKDVFKNLKI